MLHIIWSIIVGFFVGLIAKFFVASAGPMGFWLTAFVGIGGSIVGGLIARIFSKPKDGLVLSPRRLFPLDHRRRSCCSLWSATSRANWPA